MEGLSPETRYVIGTILFAMFHAVRNFFRCLSPTAREEIMRALDEAEWLENAQSNQQSASTSPPLQQGGHQDFNRTGAASIPPPSNENMQGMTLHRGAWIEDCNLHFQNEYSRCARCRSQCTKSSFPHERFICRCATCHHDNKARRHQRWHCDYSKQRIFEQKSAVLAVSFHVDLITI